MPLKDWGSVSARVVAGQQPLAEIRRLRADGLQAARVHRRQRGAARHQVHRSAPLRAGLGEGQGARGELQRSHQPLGGGLGACRIPAQPARDHEVQDEEPGLVGGVALQFDDDALAEAPDALHGAPLGSADRRQRRAKQEGVGDADALQHAARHLRREALGVDGDVGQLGHGDPATRRPAAPRRPPCSRRTPRWRRSASPP